MVKYIRPSFEILTPIDREYVLKIIERAGRTCYKSEECITTDSASKFVSMIVKRGHLSVIEHFNVTVKFICNRGVTHEFVRHRIVSYSQESTRYCNYGKDKFDKQISVIDQRPMIASLYNVELIYGDTQIAKTDKMLRIVDDRLRSGLSTSQNFADTTACKQAIETWMAAMNMAEEAYLSLIGKGVDAQFARGVLPIDIKTEIVATANLREWLHIFEMRCSPAAHPNIRQLMIPLREKFREILPEVYGATGS